MDRFRHALSLGCNGSTRAPGSTEAVRRMICPGLANGGEGRRERVQRSHDAAPIRRHGGGTPVKAPWIASAIREMDSCRVVKWPWVKHSSKTPRGAKRDDDPE